MRKPRGVSLPWSRAPRAALGGKLTLVVAAVTALLSCFLAGSAVLIGAAAGGAATDYQAAAVCPDSYGPVFSRAGLPVEQAPVVADTVRRQAAAHGFPQPVTSLFAGVLTHVDLGPATGRKIKLSYRDGALGQVQQLQGGGAGLWVGDDLTRFSPVRPGDPVNVLGFALPPVAGVYHALTVPPPRWWCSQQTLATVYAYANDPIHTVALAGDQRTFDAAVATLGLPTLDFTVSFYLDPPRTTGEARADLDRSRELIDAVRADLRRQGLGDVVAMQIPFERSLQIAGQAEHNVLVSILPLAAISVLVGFGAVATVALQWYQRRRTQVRLLAARGSRPAALGGLAVAELGLPVLAGGIVGIVLARVALPLYAPPGQIGTGSQVAAAGIALGALLVSLLVLGVVVAVRTHRDFQVGRRPVRALSRRLLAFVPWELATAGLAVLGWSRLAGYGASSRQGTPLPQVDPLALTYPVFVVLTAGLVAARLVWLLLRASHHVRWWSKPPLQLAIRRLAGARAPVTGVLVVGVLAIGTLAAGSGIARGQHTALDDKSGILVGANSRVDVETGVGLGTITLPPDLRGTSTVAGRTSGTGSVVLVVDPATFASAAYLGPLRDRITELLPKLTTPVPGGLPALRIGHAATQSAALPGLPPAVTVADLPWFPLLGGNLGYVVSRTALTPAQLAAIPQWSLLSQQPLERVSAALSGAGLTQIDRTSRDGAVDALPFYVVEWTFSFVTVLGGVLGVVAVLALLVAVEVRRRQNALAGALVLRMGMRVRTLFGSHLIELGLLAGLAAVAGVVCGVTVAGLAVPRFDPVRWLAPRSALPDQTMFVLAVLAAGVLVVLLAGWLAVRSVRTARTVELLRG
ncbi:putative ABC transport system permease protein [Amycolatopsis bartoniae]|uniref:Permease n=1 Tax=Amycolatopsis bartoniae TaxID=941986 RepID=A0A8H9IN19_9PSEU|nr:ABC transporter permease [Amycolatopsis bartoniae]MBB2938304.1 putative ABC transport system permease protein [Amycolatopsis bartoniae]TVT09070.1 ABC transporter permease [Amycolatopsis bartoniae]GHF34181.1 permease [Amycolatopsis bartoniae]